MDMDTKTLLKKFNIRPIKSLGQNFLNDNNTLKAIVDSAGIGNRDIVIEIGPGLGGMTSELAARAGRVVAVEIDKYLMPVLRENLKAFSNVTVLNKDIMKMDIGKDIMESEELTYSGFKPDKIRIVANLPYYITTPVVMKLLEQELSVECMVFMVQTEVSDRMAAEPGGKEYGALSVAVQFYSRPHKLFNVSPQCFIPQPAVESSVIRLDIYKTPPVQVLDRKVFFKTVKAAFGQRRKTLINALYNAGCFSKSKVEIREILRSMGIDENQRGETLSLEQFARLSNLLLNNH
ncbi:MAG: 16S rRNA (adenine(1518)-N(6)/adenine(1519)-N(6))-dimethyltransferase RsmA [Ruminiclostridium sp.]|nr:16S rRNA (adenine(1518)-N(6)/adenine(1519)-N(6))-dimethyltransferase RsmA [Ruminiclostridium sp.]